jgi:glycine cleavage system aminomethyltransferase T
MKKTPFFDIHTQLGAKISLFGGYQMPIQYSGVQQEHLAVRQNLGVFDVSHMGEFIVEGSHAFDLLQFICSNDISKLIPGKAQYNYLPNDQGGVVDDLIVYQLQNEKYLLVVNASNVEKDWDHIERQNKKFNARLENVSEKTGPIGHSRAQSPRSHAVHLQCPTPSIGPTTAIPPLLLRESKMFWLPPQAIQGLEGLKSILTSRMPKKYGRG